MKLTLSALTLSILLSSTCMANSFLDDPLESSGQFYAGASMGVNKTDCTNCEGIGWKGLAGYKANENLAFEGAYNKLFSDSTDNTDINGTGISLATLGIYPVNPDLDVFGKVGMMAWETEATTTTSTTTTTSINSGTDLLLGAGANYKLDENWGVRAEYERTGGNFKSNNLSAGMTYSTY